MKLEEIEVDQIVTYIPSDRRVGDVDLKKNTGIVTSKNNTYVFVRYGDNIGSQATRPEDLYPAQQDSKDSFEWINEVSL